MQKQIARTFFTLMLSLIAVTATQAQDTEKAIFAGGCFWCVESDFDNVPGVQSTVSGYIGGNTDKPTYKNHSAGKHREAVEITYDPATVSYDHLLEVFWRSVNPTDAGGQFCDRGHSYTTAIYTVDDSQAQLASESKTRLQESKQLKSPVITSIENASEFWPAEEYHQDYHNKNPIRYKFYRNSCGRDKQVKSIWGSQAHAGISKH